MNVLVLSRLVMSHKCLHDRINLQLNMSEYDTPTRPLRSLKEETWKPLRLQFVYDFLELKMYDKFTCRAEGQPITFLNAYQVCRKVDVITTPKWNVIEKTMDNVRGFLEKLIKVIPEKETIKLARFNDEFVPEEYKCDADMCVAVLARPFGMNSPTLAAASHTKLNPVTKRPVSGVIFINLEHVPDEPQDENSWHNEFFMTCLHEMIHALGFTPSLYKYFHPLTSNQPHKQITCTFQKYNRQFTFLVGPYAKIFAQKRYGVDTFHGDNGKTCPAGIEIEDAGGEGTATSHLEVRVHMTELMVGVTIQQNGPWSRLTDATLAVLMDTGFYKLDWRMARPLVWGNPESIDGKPIKDFALGPPTRVFPEGYLILTKTTYGDDYTGFNYKYGGGKRTKEPHRCRPNENTKYCKSKEFYNPDDLYYNTDINPDIFDFMAYKQPETTCKDGKAKLPGSSIWVKGILPCGPYECNGFESYTIKYQEEGQWKIRECTKENANKVFLVEKRHKNDQGFPTWCPDPERFCRTMRLHEMHFVVDPFDPDSKQINISRGGRWPNQGTFAERDNVQPQGGYIQPSNPSGGGKMPELAPGDDKKQEQTSGDDKKQEQPSGDDKKQEQPSGDDKKQEQPSGDDKNQEKQPGEGSDSLDGQSEGHDGGNNKGVVNEQKIVAFTVLGIFGVAVCVIAGFIVHAKLAETATHGNDDPLDPN